MTVNSLLVIKLWLFDRQHLIDLVGQADSHSLPLRALHKGKKNECSWKRWTACRQQDLFHAVIEPQLSAHPQDGGSRHERIPHAITVMLGILFSFLLWAQHYDRYLHVRNQENEFITCRSLHNKEESAIRWLLQQSIAIAFFCYGPARWYENSFFLSCDR